MRSEADVAKFRYTNKEQILERELQGYGTVENMNIVAGVICCITESARRCMRYQRKVPVVADIIFRS